MPSGSAPQAVTIKERRGGTEYERKSILHSFFNYSVSCIKHTAGCAPQIKQPPTRQRSCWLKHFNSVSRSLTATFQHIASIDTALSMTNAETCDIRQELPKRNSRPLTSFQESPKACWIVVTMQSQFLNVWHWMAAVAILTIIQTLMYLLITITITSWPLKGGARTEPT